MSTISMIQESINKAIECKQPVGQLSDGYHSFNELYDHRIELYIQLLKFKRHLNYKLGVHETEHVPWRTQVHSDGSIWEGWFILGLFTEPGKQITYHLPMSRWDDCKFAMDVASAPEWDGHTSADVLERLKNL